MQRKLRKEKISKISASNESDIKKKVIGVVDLNFVILITCRVMMLWNLSTHETNV